MNNDIQISVVIPTYNRAHLVTRAIESALQQTKRPFEIIVVDDGSQDDTQAQVTAFGNDVIYLFQDNAGSAVARNNGMIHAQSEWIALLDSDDVWMPDHLERMEHAIRSTNGQASYYFANTLRPIEKGGDDRWQAVGFAAEAPYEFNTCAPEWVLISPQPMMLQSTVFNKNSYLDVGGFLPTLRYRDDTHLFMRLGLDGPVCAVSGISTKMLSDDAPENRLTLSYDQDMRGALMHVIMFEDLLETMPQIPEKYQKELKERLAHNYFSLARHKWRDNRYWGAIKDINRCLFVDKAVFASRVLGNLQKVLP